MRAKREDSGPDQVVQVLSLFSFVFLPADFDIFLLSRSQHVYDIVLCVYERFRVDGLKSYVNDDRFRVDGDKNMRLLAFAFTIVFVWTGPELQTGQNLSLRKV